MKKEVVKKEKNIWIDVHNDQVMRDNGLIRPDYAPVRDKSVWSKTRKEKEALRRAKNSTRKEDMHFGTPPHRHIPVRSKLIIQLKPNKIYPKTTYSIECWQSDIPDIISNYQIVNPKNKYVETAIATYSFNGRTYKPTELPYWNVSI